jgi:hypothetical protein
MHLQLRVIETTNLEMRVAQLEKMLVTSDKSSDTKIDGKSATKKPNRWAT